MNTVATRPSIFRLMDDRTLSRTVAELARQVRQLDFARTPVAAHLRDAYQDALDRARAEHERRQW